MHPRTITVLALLLVVAACTPDDDPDVAEPEADPGLEAEVAELEAEVAELEDELEETRRENERLRQELADAEAAPAPDDPQDPELQLVGEPEPIRTEDGVTDQLRAYLPAREPEELPEEWEPGITDWRPTEVPEGFGAGAGYASPGELVTALAEERSGPALGTADGAWEVTARVLTKQEGEIDEAQAVGGLLEWGYADDAVAGRDLRLHLAEDEGGWFVEEAAERLHCLRGVTEVDDEEACV